MKIKTSSTTGLAKVLIYGTEGIGKSTFGAMSEKPVFISLEDGLEFIKDRNGNPVPEFEDINSFNDVLEAITFLIQNPHDFKTLVIDSIDWLESMVHKDILSRPQNRNVTNINNADGGYGKGLAVSEGMHRRLVAGLNALREKKNMHIILISHYQIKVVKDPESVADYESFQLKVDKKVAEMWREWCNSVIFVRQKVYLNKDDNKKYRAMTDDSRVAYTTQTPAFCAKNRIPGMPHELPFTKNFWDVYMKHLKGSAGKPKDLSGLLKEIDEVMKSVDPEIVENIKASVEKSKDNEAELERILKKMKQVVGK